MSGRLTTELCNQQWAEGQISPTLRKAEALGMNGTEGKGPVSSTQPRHFSGYNIVLLTNEGYSLCTFL